MEKGERRQSALSGLRRVRPYCVEALRSTRDLDDVLLRALCRGKDFKVKVGDNINVVMDDRLPRTLTLDEFIPYDPSCYSYEAGFFAFDADDVSFFISAESGVVYGQRE